MTSQLNVDTIVDKAGSGGTNVKMGNTSTYVDGSATQNTVNSLAKAFHAYGNQAGGGLDANSETLNISSYEDTGTGRSRLNMTNAMAVSTTYMVNGSSQVYDYGHYAVNSTKYENGSVSSTGTYYDGVTHAVIHGDLA